MIKARIRRIWGRSENPTQTKIFAESNYPDSKAEPTCDVHRKGVYLSGRGRNCRASHNAELDVPLLVAQDLELKLLSERTIITATHMGNMVMGIAFGTIATVWSTRRNPEFAGQFSSSILAI